jgi:RNA polymerase sigma factor (sigma-70 family)
MVHATARRILGNTHDAEEVAQECFITLLKGHVQIRHPLGPWLHRVARNRALDKIKGETRRRNRERAWNDLRAEVAEPAIDDRLQHVDAAIDALPAELRAAIIGRFLEGKPNHVLAESLGVSESTIRYRIGNGVEGIRKSLQKRGIIITTAALGALLETSLAGAAPLALRQAIARRVLAAPAPVLAPPWLFRPALVLGLGIAALALFATGYTALNGHLPRLGNSTLASGTGDAVVTTSTAPLAVLPAATAPGSPEGVSAVPAETILADVAQNPREPDREEPTSNISGTIFDERGYPLPGAMVTVVSKFGPYAFDAMQTFSATTAADGTYTVEKVHFYPIRQGFLSKEEGLVTFDPPQHYGVVHVYATAEGYQSTGEQHPVEPGTDKSGIDYTLQPGFTLHGRLLGPDGRPAANAGVGLCAYEAIEGSYGANIWALCATDTEGNFLLGLPAPGTVWLMAVASNGEPDFFEAVPAREGEIAELAMGMGASLSGTVLRADGSPLADAYVVACGRFGLVDDPDFAHQVESTNAAEIASAYMQGVYTGKDGAFSFGPLAAVPDAVLSVDSPAGYDKAGQRLLSHHVGPLRSGEETKLEIVLPGGTEVMKVAVQVVGELTGDPLPFTAVQVLNTATESRTMLSAHFEPPWYPVKRGLTEPGTYVLWPQYNNRGWTDERTVYGQELIWEAGAEKTITFRIPDPFALSVRVVDMDGAPIADADVECVGDGAAFRTEKSNAEGRLRFAGFPPNAPAWFQVSRDGYGVDETVAITGAPAEDYPEQTVVLHRMGGVEGRAVDPDGTPIANASVHIKFTTDTETWLQRQEEVNQLSTDLETDASGAFVWLDGLPAVSGTLTISVHGHDGTRLQGEPIPVTPVASEVLQLETIMLRPALAAESGARAYTSD